MAKERRLIHLYEDDGNVSLLPDPEPAEAMAPLSSRLDVLLGNSPYPASSMSMSVIPSILSVAPLSSCFDTLLSNNPYSASSTSTSITNSISSSTSAPPETHQDQTHSGPSAPPNPMLARDTIGDSSNNPRPGIKAIPSTSACSSWVTTTCPQAPLICEPITTIPRGLQSASHHATSPLPFQ